MSLREKIESIEEQYLSKYASKSKNATRKNSEEKKCDIRTEYQRDRDRILHSKSFRRLMHKTQVFVSPEGDHFRTRLTHTLEVSQIARSISRALFLNEDLTEAIALGHDLGHTPFGHAGEKALREVYRNGFKHNEQSIRVVEKLEKNGRGLNLTVEVLDGILNHKTAGNPKTLEGKVVQISDKIAYINHDIDDSIRAGVLNEKDLPKKCIDVLGITKDERIDFLIRSIIKESENKNHILLEEETNTALQELRKFMFENVYLSKENEMFKIERMLKEIFLYFSKNPAGLPIEFLKIQDEGEEIERIIIDYIAGMTDRFAIKTYSKLFLPNSFDKL